MAKSTVTYHRRTTCWGDPPIFRHDEDALHWAVGQGAFPTIEEANRALSELYRIYSVGVWARWLGVVARCLHTRQTS